jgi:glucosamine-phosphate N-acetyltransferase
VEDIVVHPKARGLGLGKQLIARLVAMGREAGCYKMTLECTDENVEFYAKCGLTRKGNQMCVYF